MTSKNKRTRLPLLPILLCALSVASRAATADEGCTSEKCHTTLLKGSTVHPIAENCETCHESVATPHPKKGQNTFKLTQEPPDLCYTCHEKFGDKSLIHFPVQNGMCTTCHNPHSSNQEKLLAQPQKDLCGTCHADHIGFKVLHGPVSAGSCTACHTPHESNTKHLLVKEGEDLCFTCHLDMPEVLKKKNVHPALQGGCTSCHNPHGSDFPKMLPQEGQEVCFLCHPQIADIVKDAPVGHPALVMEKGCASCHSPHASDNEKLLLGPVKDICTTCHDSIIPKDATVLHGPGNDGKCTRCHEPHGSQNDTLLVAKFPADTYVPYTGTEYPLCFNCHKRDLLQYPETSFATNFRDGERNLHYLHVNNKLKGRSCRLCHAWHGSKNPALIADTVPFGKWSLPLRFAKTDTGGSCAPGCHRPQSYDRKSPGKKPETQAPKK
ncbi:MAG TPA: cytochrome c3 family protein [Candidatus Binatia bacterium]|nr:cytochrome c3 family protein [Candidatus Binatia bacterium]